MFTWNYIVHIYLFCTFEEYSFNILRFLEELFQSFHFIKISACLACDFVKKIIHSISRKVLSEIRSDTFKKRCLGNSDQMPQASFIFVSKFQ